MLLEELFNYKNQLMKTFCCNKDIVKLITDEANPDVPSHTLAYKNIFPFEVLPETVDKGNTFICYDIDVFEVPNRTYLYPILYIWIFTHKSLLRLPDGGTRLDSLAIEINKELNGSRSFGLGELSLRRIERFAPITDYQGRCLMYNAKEFNATALSKKPPIHRRGL